MVVGRHGRQAAGLAPGHAHLLLGQIVVGLQLLERDGPVQHVGAADLAVGRSGAEVVGLKTQGHARPVHGGTADALDDPGWQVGIGLRVVPATGRDALIQP
ncbi:hypothetical protein FQZ97_1156470 [compost metagenome]